MTVYIAGPVLVTGGTSGIGLGIAEALARTGRPVAVIGRDPKRCEGASVALVEAAGSDESVLAVAVDTADDTGLREVVEGVLATWGRLDGLVTAAGCLARGSALDLTPGLVRDAFETNVLGTWLAIRCCLPTMLEQQLGRIVTIGSVLGTVGAPERSAYAASKGVVAAMSRSIALEVADRGVTVNCVAPGPVRTPLNTQVTSEAGGGSDATRASFESAIPVGRWGTPEDVALATLPFLATEAAWTTGSVVHVDGGYTAR